MAFTNHIQSNNILRRSARLLLLALCITSSVSCQQQVPPTIPTLTVANSPLQSPLNKTITESGSDSPFNNLDLVYQSDSSGSYQIYRHNPNGINERLTDEGSNTEPCWSPNGNQIAYTANLVSGKYELYVMDSDGKNNHRLLTEDHAYNWAADWSPDGQRILFSSNLSGQAQLYVVGLDGVNPVQLTNESSNNFLGTWSPDGKQIALTSDRADGSNEIYVINSDGSNVKRLTENIGIDDAAPAWSPDGKHIAFHSRRDGNFEIYVISPDGSGLSRVTNTPAMNEAYPDWIDNQNIIVSVDLGGTKRLAIYNIDTGQEASSTIKDISKAQYADAHQP